MTDKLYITNRTNHPMQATITDNYTGNNIITYELQPGSNELYVKDLHEGVYMIHLEDENHEVFYEQKLVKA